MWFAIKIKISRIHRIWNQNHRSKKDFKSRFQILSPHHWPHTRLIEICKYIQLQQETEHQNKTYVRLHFNQGEPPANVFSYARTSSCVHDLDTIILTHEYDLDILKMYLHTEKEVSRSMLSKVRAQTGQTHTERQMWQNLHALPQPHSRVAKTTFSARWLRYNESSRYCHDVRPSDSLSVRLSVWDGRALSSNGAC